MDDNLAQRYAPILKFSKGENFFPMRVEDYLERCSLYDATGVEAPAPVTPVLLAQRRDPRYFLVYADPRDKPINLELAALTQWPQLLSLKGSELAGGLALRAVAASRWLPSSLLPNNLTAYLAHSAAGFLGFDLGQVDLVDTLVDQALDVLHSQGRKAWKKVRNLLGPLCLPKKALDVALDQYRQVKDRPRTCYYHIVPRMSSGGLDAVLYWYFYAFNDGINWHEADWENVTLFFRDDQPVYAEYSFHSEHQGNPVNGRPQVYVALGSHASYQNPTTFNFVDVFEAGGETVSDWNCLPVTETLPDWIDFKGRWGSVRKDGLLELSRRLGGPPTGPKQHQRVWQNPAAWAGL